MFTSILYSSNQKIIIIFPTVKVGIIYPPPLSLFEVAEGDSDFS